MKYHNDNVTKQCDKIMRQKNAKNNIKKHCNERLQWASDEMYLYVVLATNPSI